MAGRKKIRPIDRTRGEALAEARRKVPTYLKWDPLLALPVPSEKWARAGNCLIPGCSDKAGHGTAHPGVGVCSLHNNKVEQIAGALMVAHRMSVALDITPVEGLLISVRRAAAWAAFYESKLAAVTDDDDLRPGGDAWDWVQGLERSSVYLTRWSKLCIDAGVEMYLVQRARGQGEQIAEVLNRAVAAARESGAIGAGADGDAVEVALRGALRSALVEMAGLDGAGAAGAGAGGAGGPLAGAGAGGLGGLGSVGKEIEEIRRLRDRDGGADEDDVDEVVGGKVDGTVGEELGRRALVDKEVEVMNAEYEVVVDGEERREVIMRRW